jgi:hypothetical protein
MPVLALMVGFGCEVFDDTHKDSQDVESWFRERLPQPAYRGDVEELLAAEDIRYEIISARWSSTLQAAGVPPEARALRILLVGRRGLIVDQDFQVFFVLSEDDLVSRIIVNEGFTGP